MVARYEITLEELQLMAPATLCGLDEAGCGALAGPVVAACVSFPRAVPTGLADSKVLSPKKREALFDVISAAAVVGVGIVDSEMIDEVGIKAASFIAMGRALRAVRMSLTVERAVVDGNYLAPGFVAECRSSALEVHCMVKADAKLAEVSAASIVAKVTRDRLMREASVRYSQYGFDKHAGYPSPTHLAALREHGPAPLHRRTFGPVAALLAS